MCHRCALSTALDPLSPPPPNITRLGDVWDHRTRCNVRRGGRRKAENAKKPCPILGLMPRGVGVSGARLQSLAGSTRPDSGHKGTPSMARRSSSATSPPVYSSMDSVLVPDDVAPGAKFDYQVMGQRNGVRAPLLKHAWRAAGNEPVIVEPSWVVVQGPRHAHSPSAVARRQNGRGSSSAIDNLQTVPCTVSQWASQTPMPFELAEDDVGWLPGPVNGSAGRALPTFTGRAMGPSDPLLSSRSKARQIMRSVQLSRSFKQKVVACTVKHQRQWEGSHSRRDATERSFSATEFREQHVELFFAVAARLGKLNPSIKAERLWDPQHHCYDSSVGSALSFLQWQWLNRHISFGDTAADQQESDSASDSSSSSSDGAEQYDRFRSRRATSDVARAQAAKGWRPGQHVGFDDLVRATRHADGRRIRHKAAVHTGRQADGLNCAKSKYFLWWEEQGWLREPDSGGTGGGSASAAATGSTSAAAAAAANIVQQQQASAASAAKAGRGRGGSA